MSCCSGLPESSENPFKTNSDPRPGKATLPVSDRGAQALGRVRAALRDPVLRARALAEGDFPEAVSQALRVLDDRDFRGAEAAIRTLKARRAQRSGAVAAEISSRRRALFGILGQRFPDAFAAFRAGQDRARGRQTAFFMVNLVAGPAKDRAFEDLDGPP